MNCRKLIAALLTVLLLVSGCSSKMSIEKIDKQAEQLLSENKYEELISLYEEAWNGGADKEALKTRIQDGYQGLLRALRSYDPEKDTKFLTYAFNCVQKAILSGNREVNIGGRSKSYSNGKLQKYRKMKKDLAQKLGRNPSIGELSIELGWRINTILSYERQLYDVTSIENAYLD